MNLINFSIVLPSAGNVDRLKKMFESFERTTKYKNKIEFLIALDKGNMDVSKNVSCETYSFPIKFFERPKTKDFTNDYYNWLSNRSIGKNIMAFNDDAWMRTVHWDKKILREIDESGMSIYCLDIPDTARIEYKHYFPCFPCVSRRGMATLGFLLCKDIRMFPADKFTFEIYNSAGRIINIRNVLIEHEHVFVGKDEMFKIYKEDIDFQSKLNIGPYIDKILVAGQTDIRKKNKLKRIINILKEK